MGILRLGIGFFLQRLLCTLKQKMNMVKKLLLDILVRFDLYPQNKNLLGRTPWRQTKVRDFIFGARSFSQQGEDLTLDRILFLKLHLELETYKGLYVDAGAYHPISHSTTYLLYKRGWQGVCIDISEKSCRLIKKFRPRDIVVNAATSDVDGKLYFKQQPNISLLHAASEQAGSAGEDMIDALTLSTILQRQGIARQIDYLNIDTEGAELKTLQGLDFELYRPRVISVEIHEQNIPAALKTELADFLHEKGYECVACNVITYFFVRE